MLDIQKLNRSAEECLGWPYVSPGTNDQNGIDCSGLLVKMYRDQGASIYHGSNTIFRNYCKETGKLTSENQLQVGMVVFKRKDWTDADKNNKWYGKDPGNLSHIGYVAGVHPLRIIHASTGTMCVTTDTKIGKWAYWGKLKSVDYGNANPSPEPSPAEEVKKKVYAEAGSDVFMRSGPTVMAKPIMRVLIGSTVSVVEDEGIWSKIRYSDRTGWMMSKFLIDVSAAVPAKKTDPFAPEQAKVISENGKPVKLRAVRSTNGSLYDELPVGTVVTVTEVQDDWCKVNYGPRKGWYMMTKFLSFG